MTDARTMSLERMIADQRAFQQRVDPRPFSGDVAQQIAYVKDMFVALVKEAGECLDETTWKPWATGDLAIHRGNLMTELTDVWCFLCNLWFVVMPDATPAEITQAMAISHDVKVQLNHRRQNEGYDGTNKCPNCGRALDEIGVHEERNPATGKYDRSCKACGTYLQVKVSS